MITLLLSLIDSLGMTPLEFSWADLKDMMRKAGEVTYTDAHQRMGKNRGEVCFANSDDLHAGLV